MSDARRDIDKARWPLLSPLLDELLDLPAEQRGARLRELQAQSPEGPALAADLQELLRRQDALEAADYLATPALQQMEQHAAAAEAAVPSNSPGQQIGSYTLEREIGQGGMGTVWLARRTDGRFEGQVAIKFLNAGLLGHGDAGRFTREGQILGKLAHPHIARLLDAGVNTALGPAQAQPYLVLEYVDGLPLDRYCDSHSLSIRARLTLFLDVLAAVAHAHTRLILHRDLKPSNILVNTAGEVKLLDFGIAKLLHQPGDGDDSSSSSGAATELTRQAGRAFTPRYAAPEQVEGGEVTTATDVYALGVLLYLLLSGGQHPTQQRDDERTTPLERLRTVVEVEPKKLSERARSARRADTDHYAGGQSSSSNKEARARAKELRGDLDTIVAKTLKKAPAERYANAAELAEDLRHWLNHEPISARPDSAAYILAKFVRRHRVAVAAGTLGLLTLSVSIGVALRQGQEAQAQRAQAEGLIEFMLGDLRKKLEPVGRLDVLDAVGEKALGYYAQQQLSSTDADSLGRRARALHLMGEIAEKRGQMAEAEQRFKEAAESTSEMLARDPKNPQRLFDHAQSSYWVGYAAWRQDKREVAQPRFEDYLRLAQVLVQLEPGKAEWLMELAWAEHNLGVLLLRSGEAQAALSPLEKARSAWQDLLPRRHEAETELSKTLGWLAEAQEQLGFFDASINSHQEKLQILARQGKRGTDRNAQDLEGATLAAMGRIHLSAGRATAALAMTRSAEDLFGQLAKYDPDNLIAVERLALAQVQVAETALSLNQLDLARAELAALKPLLARLLAADHNKPAWNIQIQGRYLAAMLQLTAPNERNFEVTLSELDAFAASFPPNGDKARKFDANSRWAMAVVNLRSGDAWVRSDPEKATRRFEAALRHLEPISIDGAAQRVKSLRAHCLMRLGRTQEARVLAETLEASAYRHPEWQVELAQRLGRPSNSSTH